MILQLDPGDDEEENNTRLGMEDRAAQSIADGLRLQLEAITGEDTGRSPATPDQVERRLHESNGGARAALERALAESTDLGVQLAVRQLEQAGIGFNWRMVHGTARQWAATYSYELIRQLDQTSLAVVQQAVTRWVESGEALPALRTALTPTFGEARAKLIAQTESTRAYAEGTLQGYRSAGYGQRRPEVIIPVHPGCRCNYAMEALEDGSAYYIFQTARDQYVCKICSPYNERRVGLARNPD